MEDYAPFAFLGNWALIARYLSSKFHIFDRPILEKYIFQIEGGHTSHSHAFMQLKIAFLQHFKNGPFFWKFDKY